MGDEEHKIYVGSLSFKTDDNSLREYFETQVDVVEAKVINDRETGRSRGFGFVTLHSEEDVRKAINELHDTELDGRPIKVSKANPRSERGGERRGYQGGGGGRGGGGGYRDGGGRGGGRGGGYSGRSYGGGSGGGYQDYQSKGRDW